MSPVVMTLAVSFHCNYS